MPRSLRKAAGGIAFHVLNRGVGRRSIFEKDEDPSATLISSRIRLSFADDLMK